MAHICLTALLLLNVLAVLIAEVALSITKKLEERLKQSVLDLHSMCRCVSELERERHVPRAVWTVT